MRTDATSALIEKFRTLHAKHEESCDGEPELNSPEYKARLKAWNEGHWAAGSAAGDAFEEMISDAAKLLRYHLDYSAVERWGKIDDDHDETLIRMLAAFLEARAEAGNDRH